jgi:hypothetical protein
MKWRVIAIYGILAFGLNASGQVKTDGTMVVVNASEKELVIAADSRRFSPSSYYSDDTCKISIFGGKLVFTVAGRAGPKVKPNSQFWNAFTVARQQFQIPHRSYASSSPKFHT